MTVIAIKSRRAVPVRRLQRARVTVMTTRRQTRARLTTRVRHVGKLQSAAVTSIVINIGMTRITGRPAALAAYKIAGSGAVGRVGRRSHRRPHTVLVTGTATRRSAGNRVDRPTAVRRHRQGQRVVTVDRTRTVRVNVANITVHRDRAVLVLRVGRVGANTPAVTHRTLGVAAAGTGTAKTSRIVRRGRVHVVRVTNNVPTLERPVTVAAHSS